MYKNKFNSLTILIPAFNELKNFEKFLKDLSKRFNVLVVDDGSIDKTEIFLKHNKINFLKNKKNLGYEKSLIKGFLYLFKNKRTKIIITMDADGQHKIKDIYKLLKEYKRNKSSLVIGSRKNKNRFIEILISILSKNKFNIDDPLSGFKLYNKKTLKDINLKGLKNLFLVDLVLKFYKKNHKITTINIKTSQRKDKPRIGNYFFANIKIFKILKFILNYKN